MARYWQLLVKAQGDTKNAQNAMRQLQRTTKKTGASIRDAGQTMTLGVTAPLAAAGIASLKFASDASETASKLKVTFGDATKRVTGELDKFAEATGASRYELRDQAATIGALLKPMGLGSKAMQDMTVNTVKLAKDLSSFHNIAESDALDKLRAGLTGESEPLKAMGILINEAAVAEEAYATGIAKRGKKLTEQQKVQARYSLILKQSKDSIGDAERTSEGFANKSKALKNSLHDLGVELGTIMLPTATKLVDKLNSLALKFQKLTPAQKKTVVAFGLVAAAIGPLLIVIGQLVISVSAILPVLAKLRLGLVANKTASIALAAAKKTLTAATTLLKAALSGIKWAAQKAAALAYKAALGAVAVAKRVLATASLVLKAALVGIKWAVYKTAALAYKAAIVLLRGAMLAYRGAVIGVTLATRLLTAAMMMNPIGLIVAAIALAAVGFVLLYKKSERFRGMVQAITAKAKEFGRSAVAAFESVKNKVQNLGPTIERIKNVIGNLPSIVKTKAMAIGAAIVSGIKNGVSNGAASIVKAVTDLGGRALKSLKNKLGIKSPSRVMAAQVGAPISEGIAVGIRSKIEAVNKAADALAESMSNRLKAGLQRMDIRSAFLEYQLAEAQFLGKDTLSVMQEQFKQVLARIRYLKEYLRKNGKKLRAEAKQDILGELSSLFGQATELRATIGEPVAPSVTPTVPTASVPSGTKNVADSRAGNVYKVTVNTSERVDTVAFMRSLRTAARMGTV